MPNSSRPAKPPRPLEREVQKSILAVAHALGYTMDRRNTGASSGSHKGKSWYVRFGKPGDSDLTGMAPDGPNRGIRVDVEVKRPGGRPTPVQVASLRATIAAGGIALWADSADGAYRMLAAIRDGARVEVDEKGDQRVIEKGGVS